MILIAVSFIFQRFYTLLQIDNRKSFFLEFLHIAFQIIRFCNPPFLVPILPCFGVESASVSLMKIILSSTLSSSRMIQVVGKDKGRIYRRYVKN